MKEFIANYFSDVQAVKGHYKADKNEGFFSKYFYRPLSFLVTPLFLKWGLSPNGVTYLNLAFGVGGSICFAWGTYGLWRFGVALFILGKLMDYVDGNVARVNDSATYLGKFLDGAIDTFVLSAEPLMMGIGLSNAYEESHFAIFGLVALALFNYSVGVMNRCSFMTYWVRIELMKDKEDMARDFERKRDALKQGNFTYAHSFCLVGLIVTGFLDLRVYFYYGFVALLSLCSILVIYAQFSNSFVLFNIPRKSRHSSKY